MTGSTGEEHDSVDALPSGGKSETVVNLRDTGAKIHLVTRGNAFHTVVILEYSITVGRINSLEIIAVEVPCGIAYLETGDGAVVTHARAVNTIGERFVDVSNFILQGREITTHVKVADGVSPLEFKLETLIGHITSIHRRSGDADNGRRSNTRHNQVLCLLAIPVYIESEAVAQETHIQANVKLL